MKFKFYFAILLFALAGVSTISYASFPVQTAKTETTVSGKKALLDSPAAESGGKSQIIALILVLLVGGLGIHRFYLGYTWQGVVQLLTAGGCGIWALIDLIRICTGDLQPKSGNYTKTL